MFVVLSRWHNTLYVFSYISHITHYMTISIIYIMYIMPNSILTVFLPNFIIYLFSSEFLSFCSSFYMCFVLPYFIYVWFGWFCCSGRIPRLSLNRHSLYFWEVEKPPPHHSQGSSTERWSRNTQRVVTARVFYVLRGFLTSPFILNNSVETTAPFNVVSHPRCSEPIN